MSHLQAHPRLLSEAQNQMQSQTLADKRRPSAVDRDAAIGDLARDKPMLSRHADDFFWLARYIERAENLARLIDVQRAFTRERMELNGWRPLLALFSDMTRYDDENRPSSAEDILHFYTLDRSNPTSIRGCLAAAKASARAIRPLIATDTFRHLNEFEADVASCSRADLEPQALPHFLDRVKRDCHAHHGVVFATQFRDQGWRLYQLGRAIETADQTSRVLDAEFMYASASPNVDDSADEESRWNALLRSVAGYHAFRRHRPVGLAPIDVARFLLCEGRFPRSVASSLGAATRELEKLARSEGLDEIAACAEQARAVQAANRWDVVGPEVEAGRLHGLVDRLQQDLAALTDALRRAIHAVL